MVPPVVGWALLCQLTLKTVPLRCAHRPGRLMQFLNLGFQVTLDCVKVTVKAPQDVLLLRITQLL